MKLGIVIVLFLFGSVSMGLELKQVESSNLRRLPQGLSNDELLYSVRYYEENDWLALNYASRLEPDGYREKPLQKKNEEKSDSEVKTHIEAVKRNQEMAEREPIRVLEIRSVFKVPLPSSEISKERLHRVSSIRIIDPHNTHTNVDGEEFTVDTTVHPDLTGVVDYEAVKSELENQLKKVDVVNIKMRSHFEWLTGSKSFDLDLEGAKPFATNLQRIYPINHYAQYGGTALQFFDGGDGTTTVFMIAFLAIESDMREKSVLMVNVEDALLGESYFNTPSGITAGVPTYLLEVIENFANNLPKAVQ